MSMSGEEDTEEDTGNIFFMNMNILTTTMETNELSQPITTNSMITTSTNQTSSLFFMLDYLGFSEMYENTLQQSLDTYHQELFRKQHDTDCTIYGRLLSETDLESSVENKCFICLENYAIGHYVTTLLCMHSFHSRCLYDAICHQHKQCPLCRTNLVYETIHTEKVLSVPPHLKQVSNIIFTQNGHQITFHSD